MFGVLYNESGGSKTPLHFKLGFTFFFLSSPLNSFTLFTTLHKKLNHCVPTHSCGKTLIFSRLHFVLMQRDSSVLYSQTLFLTNGPQALHSQHLYSLTPWSKMSEPLVGSHLDFPGFNAIRNGSGSPDWGEEGINWSHRKSRFSPCC